MIFANHWVGKKIAEVFPNQALLCHHLLLKEEQFANLHHCAMSRGFEVRTSTNKILASSLDQCVLAFSLDQCVDPEDPTVNKIMRMLATHAMANAAFFCTGILTHDQFFHYSLALDLYTHFTSPIRRYTDIIA
ncbi:hypothetical protein DPMN_158823 [Dreissena polymorpha]|uniref:DIS3-like exonuclease 1 n=2 Tax=Dreissena polymorpha TaxID=45954 RepID=A0A9D4EHZ3_DREPO|nr:hypothetical protein DPMN_158823 [Dreissena polymorpha]